MPLNDNANAGELAHLALPVTSVSSKRLFSVGANILSKRRARASADMLQMRTFLRANRDLVDFVAGLDSLEQDLTRLEVNGEDLKQLVDPLQNGEHGRSGHACSDMVARAAQQTNPESRNPRIPSRAQAGFCILVASGRVC